MNEKETKDYLALKEILNYLSPLPIHSFVVTGNPEHISEIIKQVKYRREAFQEALQGHGIDLAQPVEKQRYRTLQQCLIDIKKLRLDVGSLKGSTYHLYQKLVDINQEFQSVTEHLEEKLLEAHLLAASGNNSTLEDLANLKAFEAFKKVLEATLTKVEQMPSSLKQLAVRDNLKTLKLYLKQSIKDLEELTSP